MGVRCGHITAPRKSILNAAFSIGDAEICCLGGSDRHIPAIISLSYCDLEGPKVVMYWEPDIIIARFINVYTDPNP